MINPVQVLCDICGKEFSSSTIQYHSKKHHPEDPHNYLFPKLENKKEETITECPSSYDLTRETVENSMGFAIPNADNRVTCIYCRRNFMQERIEKHQKVCETNYFNNISSKKKSPKVENSAITLKHKINLNYPNSKWQKQHIDMIKKLRIDDCSENYEEYITCQYCKRKFAPIPAEKHIAKCKDIINRPKPPPQKISILPKIYEKNLSFVKEISENLYGKATSRNSSLSGIHNKHFIEGGFTERVGSNDCQVGEPQISIMRKINVRHITEPRSKSIYKISNTLCRCGELMPSRAIYCMMCGQCRYG